jgi:hypothetical protein
MENHEQTSRKGQFFGGLSQIDHVHHHFCGLKSLMSGYKE